MQEKKTDREPKIRLAMKKAWTVQCVSLSLGRESAVIATCATMAPCQKVSNGIKMTRCNTNRNGYQLEAFGIGSLKLKGIVIFTV